MKTQTLIAISTLFAVSIISSQAAVVPVNIVLMDGSTSYSIPAGKVLQIEHLIWALEGDSTHQRVSIKPRDDPSAVGDFQLKFESTSPRIYPEHPVGRLAGCHDCGAAGGSDGSLCCRHRE
jgi:hypothetical protein